jgi:hypothetical protein
MNPTSVDIKGLIVAAGLGVFGAQSGWAVAISRRPDTPDQIMTIYDSGSWRAPNPALLIDYPTINVNVRGSAGDYAATYTKALAVRDLLLGLPAQTVGGTRYVSVTVRSDPYFLAYDEMNRPEFTINFDVIRTPASGTNRRAI